MPDKHDMGRTAADGAIMGLPLVAVVNEWVAPLGALVTILWRLIKIWETKTVQGLVKRLRSKKE